MFVSRHRYEEKAAEVSQLQQQYHQALDRISALEAENQSLQQQNNELQQSQSTQYAPGITKGLLDSLQQVGGIRKRCQNPKNYELLIISEGGGRPAST